MGLPRKCSLISVSGACNPQVGQLRETTVNEGVPNGMTGVVKIIRDCLGTCPIERVGNGHISGGLLVGEGSETVRASLVVGNSR